MAGNAALEEAIAAWRVAEAAYDLRHTAGGSASNALDCVHASLAILVDAITARRWVVEGLIAGVKRKEEVLSAHYFRR